MLRFLRKLYFALKMKVVNVEVDLISQCPECGFDVYSDITLLPENAAYLMECEYNLDFSEACEKWICPKCGTKFEIKINE